MSNVRQRKVFLQTAGFLGFLWGAWTHPQPPRSHIAKSKHTQDSHGRNDAGIADRYVFKNEQFLNSTAIIKKKKLIFIFNVLKRNVMDYNEPPVYGLLQKKTKQNKKRCILAVDVFDLPHFWKRINLPL